VKFKTCKTFWFGLCTYGCVSDHGNQERLQAKGVFYSPGFVPLLSHFGFSSASAGQVLPPPAAGLEARRGYNVVVLRYEKAKGIGKQKIQGKV